MFRIYKKKKNYHKFAETRVNKILITILLILETMQHLIIKPWRVPLDLGAGKKKIQKPRKNCQYI